jgi:hypothetical protein
MISPQEMVKAVRSDGFRCRTGVLGLPQSAFGQEAEIAASLDVELLDFRERMLAAVPTGSRFVHVSVSRVIEDLDGLANASTGESCVLLAGFDLAVAKLPSEEKRLLWHTLFSSFPHKKRSLILCVPNYGDGRFVLPDSESRQMWRGSERYADWSETMEKGSC